MKRAILLLFLSFLNAPLVWAEEGKKAIEVFPSTPFYRFIIYENLVIFWIAILGLLVIIRMKLREIERVQQMGLGKEGPASIGCLNGQTGDIPKVFINRQNGKIMCDRQ